MNLLSRSTTVPRALALTSPGRITASNVNLNVPVNIIGRAFLFLFLVSNLCTPGMGMTIRADFMHVKGELKKT